MTAGVIALGFIGIVSDDPAVRTFYRDVVGLPTISEGEDFAYFGAGGTGRIEILGSGTASAGRQRRDSPSVGLLVDSLEPFVQSLDRLSVGHSPTYEWRGDVEAHRWCYLADPSGTVLLAIERSPIVASADPS